MEPSVSDRDRRAFERQVSALVGAEQHDEGSPQWKAAVVEWADRQRSASGVAPLSQWWETKTEPQMHERARALGLLD